MDDQIRAHFGLPRRDFAGFSHKPDEPFGKVVKKTSPCDQKPCDPGELCVPIGGDYATHVKCVDPDKATDEEKEKAK